MVAFKAFRRFNVEHAHLARVSSRINHRFVDQCELSGLTERCVRALAERNALVAKEVVESFEFFERVRRQVRGRHVVDLCCGHGLTGMLFALFERQVERVTLLDQRRVDSVDVLLEVMDEVAPWVRAKVVFVQGRLNKATVHLDAANTPHLPIDGVLAVHACGARTDACLQLAVAYGARVAVMPCCYASATNTAPNALQHALGAELSADIERTYRLERAGYKVSWSQVPAAITPMHRILVATPAPSHPAPAAAPPAPSTERQA